MHIKKGDTVIVLAGRDKGKTGKILKAMPKDGTVLVEGINMVKKHQKPTKQGQKGQIISKERAVSSSSVALVCKSCGKPTRIGYKLDGENKVRICRKCKNEV